MIVLVTGDFGVGKDTFADMLIEHFGKDAIKIKSYTTRKPRYDGEKTHKFISKESWIKYVTKYPQNIVAQTEIDGEFYGTCVNQFGSVHYDVYVVDDIGIRDTIASEIDDVFIVEIKRPSWLITVSKDRLNRKRTDSYEYEPDYVVINDTTLNKLNASAREVYNWLMVHNKN